MKRITMLMGLLLMVYGLLAQTAIAPAVGTGTEFDPYQIASWENLCWITASNEIVSTPNQNTRWSAYYKQIADITFPDNINTWNDGKGWNPIGNNDIIFIGYYDGDHRFITNLFINSTTNNIGLFFNSSAEIKNINLINVNITGGENVGGLVGYNYGTISNCYSTGIVNGNNYAGGLVGFNPGTISNCYSTGTVTGYYYVGGFVGSNEGLISNCYSTGTVNGNNYVGGFVGHNKCDISNCYSTGTVTGYNYVGGFTGYTNEPSVISFCYSSVDVTGVEMAIGGFAGNNNWIISKCYSIGTVTGYSDVGGFIGINNKTIELCYSLGDIVGTHNCGGFVGENTYNIKNCYSRGNTRKSGDDEGETQFGGFCGSNQANQGLQFCYSTGYVKYFEISPETQIDKGFIGYNIAPINNNFWDINTSGASSTGGYPGITGKTTLQMTTEAISLPNFYIDASWDFKDEDVTCTENFWNIGHGRNDGYPYFDWQYPTDDATLPVTLSAFSAVYTTSNTVSILWTTQSESNMIGYNILRSENNQIANASHVSDNLIQAENSSTEHNYEFVDNTTNENTEYYYWLMSTEMNGAIEYYGPVYIKTNNIIIAPPLVTLKNMLNTAYPNPFNPSTTISFELVSQENVVIDIYNIRGQLIKSITNKTYNAGKHSLVWDGKNNNRTNCSSGVFFCKMTVGKYSSTLKLMMLK